MLFWICEGSCAGRGKQLTPPDSIWGCGMLTCVLHNDGSLAALEAQWKTECEASGEDYEEYASTYLPHARQICGENGADDRYRIYALKDGESYVAIMHVNRAQLPKSDGWTLRLNWVLLSPRFDYTDVSAAELAKIVANTIRGAVILSDGEMPAKHIKIRFGNATDRDLFTGISAGLQMGSEFASSEIKGAWMEITKSSRED